MGIWYNNKCHSSTIWLLAKIVASLPWHGGRGQEESLQVLAGVTILNIDDMTVKRVRL
ncbi:MAG: hypothetical protein H7Z12_07300 [Rhodospirillaceae bacterium]|nr:hypothetical protein [Rhodospirillales bacterium]